MDTLKITGMCVNVWLHFVYELLNHQMQRVSTDVLSMQSNTLEDPDQSPALKNYMLDAGPTKVISCY